MYLRDQCGSDEVSDGRCTVGGVVRYDETHCRAIRVFRKYPEIGNRVSRGAKAALGAIAIEFTNACTALEALIAAHVQRAVFGIKLISLTRMISVDLIPIVGDELL
jgi:hypothetical protein